MIAMAAAIRNQAVKKNAGDRRSDDDERAKQNGTYIKKKGRRSLV